ncbi:hypothetical protein [Neorhizobium sp. NCHU2750]|uniref:hypothetical protein n=1 Tax=Neorhizobium sp. NCHU2750 TaxID=1825976 RepID=UPI0013C539AD
MTIKVKPILGHRPAKKRTKTHHFRAFSLIKPMTKGLNQAFRTVILLITYTMKGGRFVSIKWPKKICNDYEFQKPATTADICFGKTRYSLTHEALTPISPHISLNFYL